MAAINYIPNPREEGPLPTPLPGGDLGGGGSGGSGGSGGTGSGDKQVYAGRNPTPPINPAVEAISYDADGVITQWNTVTQAWQ